MALVNIETLLTHVARELAKVNPPGGIELLSYKRNRSIVIQCLDEKQFLIKERGYVVQEMVSTRREYTRLLKVMIKREFPRSRKVRVMRFDRPEAIDRKLKKI